MRPNRRRLRFGRRLVHAREALWLRLADARAANRQTTPTGASTGSIRKTPRAGAAPTVSHNIIAQAPYFYTAQLSAQSLSACLRIFTIVSHSKKYGQVFLAFWMLLKR